MIFSLRQQFLGFSIIIFLKSANALVIKMHLLDNFWPLFTNLTVVVDDKMNFIRKNYESILNILVLRLLALRME